MCGIAGVIGAPDADKRVASMLAAMRHRGPDGDGIHSWPGGAAGMVRLALSDPSERGDQPMWSPNRDVSLIFNGEMYNHAEHRARLQSKGYSFRSTSDTEVVLALYLEDPRRFVDSMRGMFALAICDWRDGGQGREPKVVLARDPFGMKPLYVSTQQSSFRGVAFASELRALLASGLVDRQISPDGLRDFLTFGFVLQPTTMITGVRMLERGTMVTMIPDRPNRTMRYWSLPPASPNSSSFAEAATELRANLEESVRLHALADVPVGAFLSGGIDSSAIVAMMAQHNSRLRTYTLRLANSEFDESSQAATFANRFGCKHTEVEIRTEALPEIMEKFASQIDQPSSDGINTWLVSRAAAHDVKGVLSGLGGDEWFNGYPVAGRMARRKELGKGWAMGEAAVLAHHLPRPLQRALRRPLPTLEDWSSPLELWAAAHRVFAHDEVECLLGKRQTPADQLVSNVVGRTPDDEHPLDLSQRIDSQVYMQSQLLRDSDATSMANSLELRLPFVDTRIVECARRTAPEYRYNRGATPPGKRVLLKAVEDLLPPDLLLRPKRGFSLPYSDWLAGPMKELLDSVRPHESLANRGWLTRKPNVDLHGYPKQWSLLVLELWAREVFDRQLPDAGNGAAPITIQSIRSNN